jgi:predicted DCC family thiol-disulfide oxidoreductase YuxK
MDTGEVFVFDADCGLCNAFVRFVNARASRPIRFVPWQDALESAVVTEQDIGSPPTTSAFIDHRGIATRAIGIARVLGCCRPPWSVVGGLMRTPGLSWLANLAYGIVARNRFRMPGSQCRIG